VSGSKGTEVKAIGDNIKYKRGLMLAQGHENLGLTKIVVQEELDRVLHWIVQLLIQISVGLCAHLLQSHGPY